jgi:8-oxo-dGTP pyrophosphatase MutT (NUDIX family)
MGNPEDKLIQRKIAVVIFFDKDMNVLVQERRGHSKVGEKYGFYGGGIEEGETSEQALMRELREELGYKPKVLIYGGVYSFTIELPGTKYDGETRHGEMYFSPITSELMDAKSEGDTEKVIMPFDRILENRNKEFGPIKINNLMKIKKDLVEITSQG